MAQHLQLVYTKNLIITLTKQTTELFMPLFLLSNLCADLYMTGWAEQCGNNTVFTRCWIFQAHVDFWCQLLWFPWKRRLKSQNHLLLQVFTFSDSWTLCISEESAYFFLSRQNGKSYVGVLDHDSDSFSKVDIPFSSVNNIVSTVFDELPNN